MGTNQQITQAMKAATPLALSSVSGLEQVPPAPEPDDVWRLPGGTAWVYYGERDHGLTRPVILADGFASGPSELDPFWDGLERGAFPLASELRGRGRDVILLGYDDRSASILDNAQTTVAATHRPPPTARATAMATGPAPARPRSAAPGTSSPAPTCAPSRRRPIPSRPGSGS